MCGLLGYAGPSLADNVTLVELGYLAATRGPHSHGYARLSHFTGREPRMVVKRGEGSLEGALPDLDLMMTRGIIAHSRLATTGTYAGGAPPIEDTMPFLSGGVAIVHNGNVRRHQEIKRRHGIETRTGCDSEVIAHLVGRTASQCGLPDALKLAVEIIDDDRPFVVIALDLGGNLAAMRRGLPLFALNRGGGWYLCSRRPEMEDVMPVPEMEAWSARQRVGVA